MKNNSKKRTVHEATLPFCLYSSAISTLICIGIALLMLAVFALIALFFPDPSSSARIFGYVSLYLTSFLCGALSRSFCRGYTLICGLLSGVFFTLTLLIASLLYPSDYSGVSGILLKLILPLFSVAGAYVVSFKPKKRSKHKRR